MSASLALAGVGACTRQPPESIVPYVRQPEDLVPGRPLFFASAIPFGGVARPVLVESHMGRPTKIEGNPEHPASLGATDALTQAAVLGLYDPDRAQTVTYRGEVRPWAHFCQAAMQSALGAQKASQGAGLRILTEPITSPVARRARGDGPQATTRRPTGISTIRLPATASDSVFGRHLGRRAMRSITSTRPTSSCRSTPTSWARGPVDGALHARLRRSPAGDQRVHGMNRLYAVESTPTLTGIKAEHRLPLRASDIEGFCAEACGSALALAGGQAGASSPLAEKWIAAVAKDLQAHRGRSVVIAGDYQPAAVHALAHAMNQALGNIGTTVTYGPAIEPNPISQHASLAELATAMDAGQVAAARHPRQQPGLHGAGGR